MLLGIYAAILLCLVGVALTLVPMGSSVRLAGAGGLVERVERRRRLWSSMLAFLGKLTPAFARAKGEFASSSLYAGSRLTGKEFQGIRVASVLGCCGVFLMLAREFGSVSPAWLALAGALGWVAPTLWLKSRIAKRKRAILRLLPEVFDLLAISIGAGVDFLGALNKVVLIKEFQQEPLIEELSTALQEIRLGKRRAEALKAMAKRVEVPEISSFVRTLVQADRMGTPIAQVLLIHSEDVRLQRFVRAERAALQAPIKILGPLIFCIMPCVAIIVGAPIFLQFMRQNPFGR